MMGMATTNPMSVGDSDLLWSHRGKNGRYIPWLVKLAACNAPRRSSRALCGCIGTEIFWDRKRGPNEQERGARLPLKAL